MFSQSRTNKNTKEIINPKGSLRSSFLVVILPIAIMFILLMGGLTYIRARDVISNQVNDLLRANLNSLKSNITRCIKTGQDQLVLALQQSDLRAVFEDPTTFPKPGFPVDNKIRENVLNQLSEITKSSEGLRFNQFIITTPDGSIIIASEKDLEGQNISTTQFYKTMYYSLNSMAIYDHGLISEGKVSIITSVPYYNEQDQLRATVFGITDTINMIEMFRDVNHSHPNTKSYLITQSSDFIGFDPDQMKLTHTEPSVDQSINLLPLIEKFSVGIFTDEEHILSIKSFDQTSVISNITWLSSLKAALVVEIPEEVAFGELNEIGPYTLALTISLATLLAIAIWAITQRLVNPLRILTETTQQIVLGKWDKRVPISQDNEIGQLSHSFNQMADELGSLYQSLEVQIADRTNSLEKRNRHLEATAKVAREAAAIRKLDELLTYITHLISDQFGFYHTGIFLIDNSRKYAILQASNSQGGQRMLELGHKLEIGQKGVVGYVAAKGFPRIALDVGSDPFFFDNPDLPNTRSELALPLKIRNLVIGVMDVQSTEPSAFEESDIEILQILADQIALAIDNTRLYEQSQEVIKELQNTYQSLTLAGWSRRIKDQPISYHFDRVKVAPASEHQINNINKITASGESIQNTKDGSFLTVPLQLRDQTIGSITLLRDPEEPSWTPSDLSIVQDSINQVVAALDNARLLEETRRTVNRERLISEINAKIRETLDIEIVAKTAIEEIQKKLNLSDVSIQLGNNSSNQQQRS